MNNKETKVETSTEKWEGNVKDLEKFSDTINKIHDLHPCPVCGHITDKDLCNICVDENRNKIDK